MSQHLFSQDVLFYQRFLKSSGYYEGGLDGEWKSDTERADERFTSDSLALKAKYGEFDPRSEANISTLHIAAQEPARKLLAHSRHGRFTCRIISGTRSYAEQNALFKKGRFGNSGARVTNARGGESNHNFCIAWDVGLFDSSGRYLTGSIPSDTTAYEELAGDPEIRQLGLEWGGSWRSFRDIPHYQIKSPYRISEIRARFEAGVRYL